MNIILNVEEFGNCPICGTELVKVETEAPDFTIFWTLVCKTCQIGWEVPENETPKDW